MRPGLQTAALFLVSLAISYLHAPPAQAMRFYYELGGGIAQIRAGQSFFDSQAPSVLGLGTALALGFGVDFYTPMNKSNYHIGLQHRYSSGSSGNNSFSWHAPYLVFRLEASNLILSAGVSPILWKRISTTAGIDAFTRATSSIGALGELGYQWPITPEVSVVALASTQYVKTSSTWSPRPSIEMLALLRFFLGGKTVFEKSRSYYGSGGMGEYEGFRYPYGWDLKH